MHPDSSSDQPFSIEHTVVSRNLASLRRVFDDLALSTFHVRDNTVHLSYRATLAAVTTYGHAAIQAGILRTVSHETGTPRTVNVDVVHHHILHDPLVVMRTAFDGEVWVLLGSEYCTVLGLPWPSDAAPR